MGPTERRSPRIASGCKYKTLREDDLITGRQTSMSAYTMFLIAQSLGLAGTGIILTVSSLAFAVDTADGDRSSS